MTDLSRFPGGDLVAKGLADLQSGLVSEEALLVLVAKTRLRNLGLQIAEAPQVEPLYEHRLYEAIEARNAEGAHSEYNALIRRLVSFAEAYERS